MSKSRSCLLDAHRPGADVALQLAAFPNPSTLAASLRAVSPGGVAPARELLACLVVPAGLQVTPERAVGAVAGADVVAEIQRGEVNIRGELARQLLERGVVAEQAGDQL